MWFRNCFGWLTLLTALLGGSADAADLRGGPSPSTSRFDVAFGAAITSDYLVRGISQTDNSPAAQAFFEVDDNRFYAGAWTSNVSFSGASDQEVDLAAGWRPQVDKFAFDFGYVGYLYLNNAAASFGEAYAGVKFSFFSNLVFGAKVNFAPSYEASGTTATYVNLNLDLKLPKDFGVSGAVGFQAIDPSHGASYFDANVGVYWSLNPSTKLDLRFSDTSLSSGDCATLSGSGNVCGPKVVLSLSIGASLSALTASR